MSLNEKVWMPHFKFMMQTIAVTYPTHPNDVSKKNITISYKIYQCLFP